MVACVVSPDATRVQLVHALLFVVASLQSRDYVGVKRDVIGLRLYPVMLGICLELGLGLLL